MPNMRYVFAWGGTIQHQRDLREMGPSLYGCSASSLEAALDVSWELP